MWIFSGLQKFSLTLALLLFMSAGVYATGPRTCYEDSQCPSEGSLAGWCVGNLCRLEIPRGTGVAGSDCTDNWACGVGFNCNLAQRECVVNECNSVSDCSVGKECLLNSCITNVVEDRDRDGVPDAEDNCWGRPNPGQLDSDFNQLIGDRCDIYPAIRNNWDSTNTGFGARTFQAAIGNCKKTKRKGCVEYVTAFGYRAGASNREGNYNTVVGADAGYSLNEDHNTIVGALSMSANSLGARNTTVGSQSLTKTSSGNDNTVIGALSMRMADSQKPGFNEGNTAMGSQALGKIKRGNSNTAVGFKAGYNNGLGSGNVYIGAYAGPNKRKTENNKLYISNSPQSHLITGDFSSRGVTINGSLNSTQGISESSDVRLKKDIDPITLGLDAVLQLEGKTFKWSDESLSQETHIGLIAQDVEKVIPELVTEDENGFKAIAYAKLTTILIEAIKDQQGQMTVQQDQIAALEKENTQLKTIMAEQMDALLARVAMLEGESLVTN